MDLIICDYGVNVTLQKAMVLKRTEISRSGVVVVVGVVKEIIEASLYFVSSSLDLFNIILC